MLVRYRMNSSANVTTMRADVDKIIRGLASSTADLGAGCDTANTLFYGTYPTGKYSRVGTAAGSDTYSKIHNDYGDVTHYFRLSYDASKLTSLTLAQSYTAGTDTLVNSREIYRYKNLGTVYGYFSGSQFVVNDISRLYLDPATGTQYTLQAGDVVGRTYDQSYMTGYQVGNYQGNNAPYEDVLGSTSIVSQFSGTAGVAGTYTMSTVNLSPAGAAAQSYTYWQIYRPVSANVTPQIYNVNTAAYGLDIVVSSKMLYISSVSNAVQLGVFDIGKNGISRLYTNNMLMAGIDLNQEKAGATLPYTYKFTTNTYGVQTGIGMSSVNPAKKFNSNMQLVIVENPVFINQEDNGNSVSVVYGLFKLPENTYAAHTTYVDGSNVRRLTTNDYSILTE